MGLKRTATSRLYRKSQNKYTKKIIYDAGIIVVSLAIKKILP